MLDRFPSNGANSCQIGQYWQKGAHQVLTLSSSSSHHGNFDSSTFFRWNCTEDDELPLKVFYSHKDPPKSINTLNNFFTHNDLIFLPFFHFIFTEAALLRIIF